MVRRDDTTLGHRNLAVRCRKVLAIRKFVRRNPAVQVRLREGGRRRSQGSRRADGDSKRGNEWQAQESRRDGEHQLRAAGATRGAQLASIDDHLAGESRARAPHPNV
jgi:hypothetical protein